MPETAVIRPVLAALALCVALPAQAETYAIQLGSRQIGTLQTSGNALASTLDNTPLGVANGTFEAGVSAVRLSDGSGAQQFLGRNRGGKVRDVSVIRQEGRVLDVTVSPAGDATDLSVPAAVPAGVLFPPEAMARLEAAGGCPAPVTMYDGRRVVSISTLSSTQANEETICEMSYRVTAGKGHLSPFNFRSLAMQLAYRDGALARITVSAGGFDVSMLRR